VQVIDILQEDAEAASLLFSRHLPPSEEFGLPLIDQRHGDEIWFTTSLAWFWVSARGVSRLLPLDGNRGERTEWHEGDEQDRTMGTIRVHVDSLSV
jgi:hypothetical protein